VIRPADANEVSACWVEIIKRGKPAGLALSRQNLPVIDRSRYESTSGSKYGAYVLSHADNSDQNNFQVILIATGSEVYLALSAQEELLSNGIKARVVSAPCLEWFMEQPASYREQVLPNAVKARVSIEAGIAQPWYRFLGDAGVAVSLEHFGASASAPLLFKEFGFTVENIVKAAKESIAKVNG
jgi:transketolase